MIRNAAAVPGSDGRNRKLAMHAVHEENIRREAAPGINCALEKTRVLVAHRNVLVSVGLEAAFRAEPDFEVVSCSSDCTFEMPSAVCLESVDVMITECETVLELPCACPRACRVLIVTADESETSIRRALEQGVAGYLLLTSSRESVIRAVRRIRDGATELDPVVAEKMVASLTRPALSPRELEVLRLVMVGLSDKAIARRLGRSVATAKSHVKAILSKLDATSRTEAAAVAHRRGLVKGRPSAAALSARSVNPA
jgi:two-component system NarL family response regulator